MSGVSVTRDTFRMMALVPEDLVGLPAEGAGDGAGEAQGEWPAWQGLASIPVDGGVVSFLRHVGRPIRYSYVPVPQPISAYGTVFGRDPGSVEMPSAGRPFTTEVVTDLATRGVLVAPVLLHLAANCTAPLASALARTLDR